MRPRRAGETVESITEAMKTLRKTYPAAGVRDMVDLLASEHHLAVPRYVIGDSDDIDH
jgi:hypothetical protein